MPGVSTVESARRSLLSRLSPKSKNSPWYYVRNSVEFAFRLGDLDSAILFCERRIEMGLVRHEEIPYLKAIISAAVAYITAVENARNEQRKRAKRTPWEVQQKLLIERAKRDRDAKRQLPEGLAKFRQLNINIDSVLDEVRAA